MIGKLNPEHREVTVIGAGIAGLLIADALDREGWVVTLYEASERAGGLIQTYRTPDGLVEAAAHSLLANVPVIELCRRLGIDLVPVNPEARARWIWRKGKLRRFPLSALEAFRAFFRAYFVLADSSVEPGQQTLEEWGHRHVGVAATRFLLTPFVRGIYGARPSELWVGAAFPSLAIPPGHSLLSWVLRRRLKNLFGKRSPRARMMTPLDGMGSIPASLAASLRERLGDRFKTGSAVRVPPHAKNLVLCVPAYEAATILSDEDPTLSLALAQVRYAPLVSVGAFARRRDFANPPRGVGVLLPEGTARKCLGVLFNSSSFPGRVAESSASTDALISLTLMFGGTSRPEFCRASDAEIAAASHQDLEKIFGLAPAAELKTKINRYERAIPLYDGVLQAAWDAARSGWCSKPGHVLFGNYTGQVSIRGMIETVAAGGFG